MRVIQKADDIIQLWRYLEGRLSLRSGIRDIN